jgi:hypothetical protein
MSADSAAQMNSTAVKETVSEHNTMEKDAVASSVDAVDPATAPLVVDKSHAEEGDVGVMETDLEAAIHSTDHSPLLDQVTTTEDTNIPMTASDENHDRDVAEPKKEDLRTWDHSNRKVVVQNVFKFFNAQKMQKDVDAWVVSMKDQGIHIEVDKIKKPPKELWMVVTLKETSMVQPFVDYINNNNIVNKKGVQMIAKPSDNDEDAPKRKLDDHRTNESDKRPRRESRDYARRPVTDDEVKDAIIPLWRQSYESQLDTKTREMIKKCAMKIVSEIKHRFRYVVYF